MKATLAFLQTHTGFTDINFVDPLVLDLNGDGLELVARSSISPLFDIDGDFYGERSGWVRPDDGILVRDPDKEVTPHPPALRFAHALDLSLRER